jgi:hypothetical protein
MVRISVKVTPECSNWMRSSPLNPSLFGSLEKLGDCLLDPGLIVYIGTVVWKTHVLPPNAPLELRNHPAVSGIQDLIGPVACGRIVSAVSAGRTRDITLTKQTCAKRIVTTCKTESGT